MSSTKYNCPHCGRGVTGYTSSCPWCHVDLPEYMCNNIYKQNNAAANGSYTSLYGLLSFIFAFIFSPLGLIFGILSVNNNTKEAYKWGKIGLSLSVVMMILEVVLTLILVFR